jgi:hypothetical protein
MCGPELTYDLLRGNSLSIGNLLPTSCDGGLETFAILSVKLVFFHRLFNKHKLDLGALRHIHDILDDDTPALYTSSE